MRPAILRLGMLPPGLERPSNLLSMWYLYLCGTSEKRFFPKFAVTRVSRPQSRNYVLLWRSLQAKITNLLSPEVVGSLKNGAMTGLASTAESSVV